MTETTTDKKADEPVFTNWRGAQFTKKEWDAGKGKSKKATEDGPPQPASTFVTKEEWDAEHNTLIQNLNEAKKALWDHGNPTFEVRDEQGNILVDSTGTPTPKASISKDKGKK